MGKQSELSRVLASYDELIASRMRDFEDQRRQIGALQEARKVIADAITKKKERKPRSKTPKSNAEDIIERYERSKKAPDVAKAE